MIETEDFKTRIFEYLRENIIERTGIDDVAVLTLNSNLITDIGIDSVGILQIILDIEKEYDIKIDNDELDGEIFSKFENFVELVAGKIDDTF